MKITCDVIKDLIPAYVDGTLSNDSKTLVDEHVSFCTECKAYMEDIQMPRSEQAQSRIEQARPLRKIKNRLLRRNIRIIIITTICLVAFISCFCAYDNFHPKYMTSNQVEFKVKNTGDQIGLYGKRSYGTANYYKKGKILFVYFTNTYTNRLISSISKGNNIEMISNLNDKYDAVYYMPKSVAEKLIKNDKGLYVGYFNSLSTKQLKNISKLVWKK